jgi:hypothetical protein
MELTTEERNAVVSLITSEIESSSPFPSSPRIEALKAAGAKLTGETESPPQPDRQRRK